MGKKREVKEPTPTVQPVDPRGLDAALRLFTTTFVIDDKRTQVHKRLVTAERRVETLTTLPRWIRTRQAPLEGADQSPTGLRARFGELVGIVLDEDGARRTTIAHALELGRARVSLFVADNGSVAMITATDAPPILCSRL
ncbi:MAG: hypothetical protein M4D80_35830 [Myxococcota bacterium]|nr:hypothetical protein [Myxococcota bacterium]